MDKETITNLKCITLINGDYSRFEFTINCCRLEGKNKRIKTSI